MVDRRMGGDHRGRVAIGIGLYQHLEVTYQDDTTVFFAIDQDETNLATKAVNAYRRMFMRARGCFGIWPNRGW